MTFFHSHVSVILICTKVRTFKREPLFLYVSPALYAAQKACEEFCTDLNADVTSSVTSSVSVDRCKLFDKTDRIYSCCQDGGDFTTQCEQKLSLWQWQTV